MYTWETGEVFFPFFSVTCVGLALHVLRKVWRTFPCKPWQHPLSHSDSHNAPQHFQSASEVVLRPMKITGLAEKNNETKQTIIHTIGYY